MSSIASQPRLARGNAGVGGKVGPAAVARAGRLVSVGWISDGDVHYTRWASLGRQLGAISRCSQWWVGDWICYGARRYGAQYTHAAKLTGYDVKSLRNMAYVASRFMELSRRRDELSWSHHAEVAPLPPAEQDGWLERAVRDGLSVSDLRTELRAQRRGHGSDCLATEPPSGAELGPAEGWRTCPRCGYVWGEPGIGGLSRTDRAGATSRGAKEDGSAETMSVNQEAR